MGGPYGAGTAAISASMTASAVDAFGGQAIVEADAMAQRCGGDGADVVGQREVAAVEQRARAREKGERERRARARAVVDQLSGAYARPAAGTHVDASASRVTATRSTI